MAIASDLIQAGATPFSGCRYQNQPSSEQKAPNSLPTLQRGVNNQSPCGCGKSMGTTIVFEADKKGLEINREIDPLA